MRIFIVTLLFFAAFTATAQDSTYDKLYREGTEALKMKDYKSAISIFLNTISSNPKSPLNEYAYVNLGYAYEQEGNLNEALQSYSNSLEINPASVNTLTQRAKILMLMDEIDAALSDYNSILQIEPKNGSALFFRAYIYSRDKEYDKAIADYHTLLAQEPDNDKARLSLALLYRKSGHINECTMLLEQLIEEHPTNAEYYIVRSNMEREDKRTMLAIMDAEKAIELAPENPEYRVLLAELLIESGNKKEAKEALNAAIAMGYNEENVMYLYNKCK